MQYGSYVILGGTLYTDVTALGLDLVVCILRRHNATTGNVNGISSSLCNPDLSLMYRVGLSTSYLYSSASRQTEVMDFVSCGRVSGSEDRGETRNEQSQDGLAVSKAAPTGKTTTPRAHTKATPSNTSFKDSFRCNGPH